MITRCENGPTREKAIELGIVDDESLKDMREAWERWANAPDGYCGLLNGEVLIHT